MDIQAAQQAGSQVAFVFNNVADYQDLVAAFRPDVEVHVLDAGQDGLAQMEAILQGRTGLAALHVIGHGSEGALNMGSVTLDSATIGSHGQVLAEIGSALAPDGDILLYGCDVGASAAGAQFVGQLAQLTGADVAASTDLTGGAQLGGNWTLEYRTGAVTADNAFDAAAVHGLDTLLATNEDVTATMSTGAGNFVPGFTLTTAQNVYGDPDNGVNGGIYFDTLSQSETFTVTADGTSVGAFDLTGMTWVKAFTFGEFTLTVTGHKVGGSTATAVIYTAQNAATFSVTDSFSDMTGLTSFDVTITGTATDAGAGSTPADLTLDAFTVDNIVPPAPTTPDLTGASDTGTSNSDNLTSANSVAFTGLGPAGDNSSTALVFIDTNNNGAYDAGTDVSGTATLSGGSWTVSGLSTVGLSGVYKVYAQLSNGGGSSPLSSPLNMTVDHTAPTVAITSDHSALTAGQTATVTFTFSEDPGSTFSWNGSSGDVAVSGGTLSAISGAGTTRTAVFTPTANTNGGTASITVAAGAYTDAAGNNGGAGTTPSLVFDTRAPTVAITSDHSALAIGQTATVTFTFSEDPGSTFSWNGSSGDVVVSGGTLSAISGSGTTRTAVFTPTANTNGGTASITVAAGAYTDAAGNNGGAGTTPSLVFDTQAPTVTITSDHSALTAGQTATVTFTFSEDPGSTFSWNGSSGDVAVSGGTLSAMSGSGTTRTAVFTPTANTDGGTASISIAAAAYTDAAGNSGGAGSTPAISFDTKAPALTISSDHSALAIGQTATVTFTFSEDPGATFSWDGSSGDVSVSGGTLSAISGTGTTRTAVFTAGSGGSATITVGAGTYSDAAGNANAGSASTTIALDTTPPAAPSAPALAPASDTGTGSGHDVTKFATPVLKGTAEAGATVDLYDGATHIGSGSADGAGNWSITSTTLAEGAHTIVAVATDAANNVGPASGQFGLTVDTTRPTLSIVSDSGALKVGETSTITFTFSEDPGSTFTDGGIVVSGGTLSAITGTGTTRTAVFTPTAHTDASTAVISVAASAYTDAAGNNGAGAASTSIGFDTLAPAVTITSDHAALTAGQTATITFAFSEDPGATFTLGDVTVGGGTLSSLSGTGTTRTAVFTPAANTNGGTASITVTHDSYADAAGNTGAAGTTPSLVFDTLAPTLAVSSDHATLKAGEAATVTFTFSEDPGVDFTLGSVTVSGGTLNSLSGTGVTRSAVFTPDANTTGTATIAVDPSQYHDAAGNTGDNAASVDIAFDTVAPSMLIISDTPVLKAGETAAITFIFSEDPGSTFSWDGTSGDVTVSGGTLSAISGTGNTRTAVFTPSAGINAGTASITVASGSYTNAAGNGGEAGTTPTIHFDTLAPTVTIGSDMAALKIGQTANVTFTFSEDPGSTFTSGDVAVSGGTLGAISGTGTTRTAIFTPDANTNGGTASITIAAGTYADAAGNAGHAGTTPGVAFDTLAPAAPSAPVLDTASDSGVSHADNLTRYGTPTLSGQAEAGATVKLYDGATLVGTGTADSGGAWSIVSSTLAEGNHALTAIATDAAGNTGAASVPLTISIDQTAPTLTISSDKAALTAGQTATVTFTFSEDPGSTFGWDGTSGDVNVSGGTLSAISGTGNTRTAVFTPSTGINAGTAGITVASGAYTDAAGNGGEAGTTPTIHFDTLAPTVTIGSDMAALKIGQTANVTFTFSEDPGSTFTSGDVAVSGGILGAISGTGTTRTATFTPDANTNGGTASITIAAGTYTDAAGNAGHAGTTPGVVFDTLAPSLTISSDKAALYDSQAANITFTFSEDPGSTFSWDGTSGDVAVSGGTLSAISGTGNTRTAVFTPSADTNAGTAGITVAAGAYTDAAGNAGGAGITPAIHFDTLHPTVAITSDKTALKVGETAQLTFTFSEDPGTSFAWDGTSGSLFVTGGTVSAVTGTGLTRTAVFTPDANADNFVADVMAAPYTDAAGNYGLANSVTFRADTLAPARPVPALIDNMGFSSSDHLVGSSAVQLEGTTEGASTVTMFDADGVTVLGTAPVTFDGNWVVGHPFTEGAHTVTVKVTDAAGNESPLSAPISFVVDTTAPTMTITSDKTALHAGETATVTFTFSEDPGTTFSWDGTAGDVFVGGGTLSAISGTGLTRTAVFTPQADVNAETAIIDVRFFPYTDAAGNPGSGTTTGPENDHPTLIAVDTLAPTVTIGSDTAALKAGQTANVTFTFSEDPGSTFGSADVAVSGGTLGAISGTGTTRTAVFTPDAATNGGTASIAIAAGTYTDAAGNAGHAGTTTSLVFDTLAPAAPSAPVLDAGNDSGVSSSDHVTNAQTLTFTGTAEDGATVTLIDSGTGAVLGTGTATGGNWSIAVGELPDGQAGVAAYATDAAGNAGTVSGPLAVTIDRTAPGTPALALAHGGSSGSVVNDGTVKVLNLTSGAAWQYSLDGGAHWQDGSGDKFVVSGDRSYTAIARQIDTAGNIGATSGEIRFTLDQSGPTSAVTLNDTTLTRGETATVTVTFSEAVTGFDLSDLHASDATLSNLATADGGRTWTAAVTPKDGTVSTSNVISVDNTGVMDRAGNAGAGSSSSPDYSVVTSGLGASIALSDTSLTAGEKAVVTIHFSEPVRGLTLGDLGVQNGRLSDLSSSDGGQTWAATLTPTAGVNDATNVITLANSGVTGASGQHGDGVSTSANYSVETIRPTAGLSIADHLVVPGARTAVTIKFSEAVSGFDSADVAVTHAALSNLSSADGGVTWTATLTADAGASFAEPGAITVDLGGVHDAAGNTGQGKVGAQFVVVPGHATVGSVDGASVITQAITGTDGTAQQVITISEVMDSRVDDPSTPNHGLADIPIAANPAGGAAPILTASLPAGASLQATGSAAPLGVGAATTDLVGRVVDNTAHDATSQADLTSHAQEFLASLGSGATVESQTIVPLVAADTAHGQPIVIAGAQPGSAGADAPVVGLVIDGTSLPSGTTLQLDNVDFAAVVGDVRLIGGLGRNYVVGDGASQTIYLGPDDDVLNGGGGNDFVGSAGGNDRLNGGDGNDLVAGGIGNDTVAGDAGDDMVNGGRSTVGDWNFHIAANGTISAIHDNAVFTANGTETVQGAELDATQADLRFLQAEPQNVQGIALLYAALDRAPDLAGLSFWATSGASLHDIAADVLASAEFGGSALDQTDAASFVTGMYQHVLGRAPEQAALDYWTGRLAGSDGKPAASRADVLIAVALSDEHKAAATTADGITIAKGSVQHDTAWFSGSGDDVLNGGAGNDLLVGGDGTDTAVYSGNRSQYHILIGADNALHVLDTANGDLDTMSGIEAAQFQDGTIDVSFLNTDPAQLERVGLMFEAVLDRAADGAGLKWWTSLKLDATQLAQAFTTTAEYQAHYAGMSDAGFVQALYANSGLDASAAGGEQAWQDYLGQHTRAQLIAAWIGQDDVMHAQFDANGLWLM
jgi:hypothetical protein